MATTKTEPPPSNCEGITYDRWIDKANAYIAEKTEGLSLDDLPDGPSWDSWHAGESPEEYAASILEDAGMADEGEE